MKNFIIPIFLALVFSLHGQPLTEIRLFVIDQYNNTLPGVLTMPHDYYTNPDSCVLIVFNHGTGQSGTGSVSSLGYVSNASGVYANGSLAYWGAKQDLIYTHPINGKSFRFMTLSLQGISGWCARTPDIKYVLENDILKNYRVFRARIHITGLSAGAETTWESISDNTASYLFASAVPMSTPAPGMGPITNIINNKIEVWAFHGSLDANLTDYNNSVRLINQVNYQRPGTGRLTTYPSNHCCWATYSDPNYKEVVSFFYRGKKYTKSIGEYEFYLLTDKSSDFLWDTTGTTKPSGGGSNNVSTVTKSIPIVTIVNSNTVIVDPTQSTANGGVGSFYWVLAGPSGAPKVIWSDDNFRNDGGSTLIKKTVTNLAPGPWVFTLYLQDKYGGTVNANTIVTVGSTVTPPPIVITKTIVLRFYLGGKEFVVNLDSNGVYSVDIN